MSSNLEVAFVLAAGRGERLRPYTDTVPKPLMPIGGSPLLFHTLKKLEILGLKRVVLNAWHLKEQIREFVKKEASHFSFEMILSEEDELLGTGGGLKKAIGLMKLSSNEAPLLMVNGDILFKGDLKAFCERSMKGPSLYESYWWLSEEQKDQTSITLEGRGISKIGNLWRDEKTAIGVVPQFRGCFSGIQLIRRLVPAELPEKGCIIRDYWLNRLSQGARLGGDRDGLEFWADLGTPDRYLAVKDMNPS